MQSTIWTPQSVTAKAVNSVELDEAAELAELAGFADREATAEREAETAAAAAEVEAAGHDPAAWRKASDFIVQVAAGQVCPNWELGEGDQAELSAALAEVLDHYFPGGPNGVDNWHPLYKLGFALVTVALMRGFDWSTGRLKPLRRKEPESGASETAEREPFVPGGDDEVGQERGRFTIGGG